MIYNGKLMIHVRISGVFNMFSQQFAHFIKSRFPYLYFKMFMSASYI